MKPIKPLLILFLLLLNIKAFGQQSLVNLANTMTADQIWAALIAPNSKGETIFGKCRIGDATGGKCPSCACNYYFNGARTGSLGYYGWPKNPSSGDGTGCFQWKSGANACWPGYPSNCSTATAKDIAKAILLNALSQNPANVCGLPTKPTIKGGISVTDNSNFLFVNPSAPCAKGKILCGSTKVGSEVDGLSQFTKFPENYCEVAYKAARLQKNIAAKEITCLQYEQTQIETSVLNQAASLVGQWNTGFGLWDLAPLSSYLDYTNAEFEAMTYAQVALFYVASEKNSNLLPAVLKPRVIPGNFSKTTAERASATWIIQKEIDDAVKELELIKKGIVPPKNLSLQQAVQMIQNNQMPVYDSPKTNDSNQ